VVWDATGVSSSSEESTIAVRRVAARRDGRVDMAMGYLREKEK
jgi:hypothetical protein